MFHKKIILTLPNIQSKAILQTYFLDESDELLHSQQRPCILIFPGGAYRFTSDREAEPIALRLNAMGYHAAILRYPCFPAHFPDAFLLGFQALCHLKENAKAYHIDEHKIVTMGFSAGGHLAASLGIYASHPQIEAYFHRTELTPFAQILCYPVITTSHYAHEESFHNLLQEKYHSKLRDDMSLEKHVHHQVPATFLWHTQTDPTVPVENAILFLNALMAHQVPCEFHLFSQGEHGLALANGVTQRNDGAKINSHCAKWISLLETWLVHIGL